jgi:CubicO group peptidase (beta-lactamase class C family)
LSKVRLAAFAALIALAFVGTAAAQTAPAPTEEAKKVQAIFASFVKSGQPGGSVIVLKDGKELYKGAFGVSDVDKKTPMTTQNLFQIGSLAKQFTALGIMMLAQEGKLKYDDPVGKYLPDLARFGDKMTLRALMTHTSGMPGLYGEDDLYSKLIERREKPTNADLLAVLKNSKPAFKPGEQYEYGNPAYQMLALVLERVSGQRFEVFMQERIWGPAGMKSTFTMPNKRRDEDAKVAHSYTQDEDGKPSAYDSEELENLQGAGSVYSTVEDLALYDKALSGDTLIKQSALAEAFKPMKLNDDSDSTYGFGWVLDPYEETEMRSHPGTFLAFRSQYHKFPQQNLTVITLFNRDYGFPDDDPAAVALKVADVFLKK